MRSRRLLLGLALTLAHLGLLWASLYIDGLGVAGWHHVASLAGVLVGVLVVRRPFVRSRRFLAIGVLVFTILAAASGFILLYWKEAIRPAGIQDWGVFWHVAWSWAAMVFFFQHTWINRVAFGHFFQRSFATVPSAATHTGAYVVLIIAFFVTWSSIGKGWFNVESYIPLSFYAWLLVTTPAYAWWLLGSVLGGRLDGTPRFRPERTRLRGPVDVALVPAAALAVLSGFPLTWFDPWTDANGLQYVSKFWHVWPSVLFTVLVFVHSVHAWRAMRAHWRNLGMRVGDVPKIVPAQASQRVTTSDAP